MTRPTSSSQHGEKNDPAPSDPSGKNPFVNVQDPGITITGPWWDGTL
jgi:hypothetical protein